MVSTQKVFKESTVGWFEIAWNVYGDIRTLELRASIDHVATETCSVVE